MKDTGLFRKYEVKKLTNPDKDVHCVVLEWDDPIARVGIAAWSKACRDAGYTQLADDTQDKLMRTLPPSGGGSLQRAIATAGSKNGFVRDHIALPEAPLEALNETALLDELFKKYNTLEIETTGSYWVVTTSGESPAWEDQETNYFHGETRLEALRNAVRGRA